MFPNSKLRFFHAEALIIAQQTDEERATCSSSAFIVFLLSYT